MVPVKKVTPQATREEEPEADLAPTLVHRFRPRSKDLAHSVFTFFAGMAVGGLEGVVQLLPGPVAIRLVMGSPCGPQRVRRAPLCAVEAQDATRSAGEEY